MKRFSISFCNDFCFCCDAVATAIIDLVWFHFIRHYSGMMDKGSQKWPQFHLAGLLWDGGHAYSASNSKVKCSEVVGRGNYPKNTNCAWSHTIMFSLSRVLPIRMLSRVSFGYCYIKSINGCITWFKFHGTIPSGSWSTAFQKES
jgi:hypothetical protein